MRVTAMGKFLTRPSEIEQVAKMNKYKLLDNELYLDDDGSLYLAWRGYLTDNFTWLRSNNWDIRCSHIHDVGCQYHQLVKVALPLWALKKLGYLVETEDGLLCNDIPPEYLKVVDVSKKEVNDLFYRMMRDADCPPTPKVIQLLYRAGVALNIGWYRSGKERIKLDELYN